MFFIGLERASLKVSDKKVVNPTIAMLRRVLENAGLDEGEWGLRMPHRVRKKGCERFKAIRLDYSGGVKGIRIRCKPGGNDTSFEYTLVPPNDVEIGVLFHLMERVHPQTLKIHETIALKAAIMYPELRDMPPPPVVRVLPREAQKIRNENSIKPTNSLADEDMTRQIIEEGISGKQDVDVATIPDVCLNSSDIASEVGTPQVSKTSSLEIDERVSMSDQDVMDKALIAISFVAEDGFAKKKAASDSIIDNLGVKKFVSGIGKWEYETHQGAMRALTMALCRDGYLERIYCTSSDGRVGEGVRGYKITHRGEKRINSLKAFLHDSVIAKMNPGWCRAEACVQIPASHPQEDDEPELQEEKEENIPEKISGLTSDDLSKIKAWIASLEEATEHISETETIIANLNSEKSDLMLTLAGVSSTREEKLRLREELDKAISKLDDKEQEVKKEMAKKDKEIEDWRRFRAPYLLEKERLESVIGELTGKKR